MAVYLRFWTWPSAEDMAESSVAPATEKKRLSPVRWFTRIKPMMELSAVTELTPEYRYTSSFWAM